MEIYLDNTATTRPFKEITDRLGDVAYSFYANPSSLYSKGVEVQNIVDNSRKVIAGFLGVNSDEIFFTSGGTESNNIAIQGFINANIRNINTIVTTEIEHPSVLNVFKDFEMKDIKVKYLKVDNNGIIDFDKFEDLLKEEKVSFVSVMHVNNEIGSMQSLDKIITLKKRYGFTLHVDAVQSFGKIELSNYISDIDLLSASAHKIHGLKGTGILYIKKGVKILPIVKGGGQELTVRSGTENVVGIWAFGEAVKIIDKNMKYSSANIRELRNYFVNQVLKNIKNASLNGSLSDDLSSPYIANISFKGIPGEVMLHSLELENIYVSTGSACSSKKKGISYVLKAIGCNDEIGTSAVRFSLGVETTKDEIDVCIDNVKKIVERFGKV